MKNLFNTSDVSEILNRIDKLNANSKNHWGKMNVAQMLAHCNASIETAAGKKIIKPVPFMMRMIGAMMKPGVLKEKQWGKNSPTDKSYIFPSGLNFDEEKLKLTSSLKQFSDGGAAKCTTHPHPFFGHFTPEQWALFQWKHIDHHLRQFGI